MTDDERRACIQTVRDHIDALTWHAPRANKAPVGKALERLQADPDLPGAAREVVLRVGNYAAMLADAGASEEYGRDYLRSGVQQELDTLEQLCPAKATTLDQMDALWQMLDPALDWKLFADVAPATSAEASRCLTWLIENALTRIDAARVVAVMPDTLSHGDGERTERLVDLLMADLSRRFHSDSERR